MIVAVWLALLVALGLGAWGVTSRRGAVPVLAARTGGGMVAGLLLFAALGFHEAGLPLAVALVPWLALPDRLGPVWALGTDAMGLGVAAAAGLWLARLPAALGAEAGPPATRRLRAWLPLTLLLTLLARDLGLAAVAGALTVAAVLAGEEAPGPTAPRRVVIPRALGLGLAFGGVAALWRLTASAAVPVVAAASLRIYPAGTPRIVVALAALAVAGLGLPWLAPARRNVAAHGATALVGLFAVWRVGEGLGGLAGPMVMAGLAGLALVSLGLGLRRRRLAPGAPALLLLLVAARSWPGLANRLPGALGVDGMAVGLAASVALLLGPLADVPSWLRRGALLWLARPAGDSGLPAVDDASARPVAGVAMDTPLAWEQRRSARMPAGSASLSSPRSPWYPALWPLALLVPGWLLWSRWLDGFVGHPLGQPLALVAATLATLRAAQGRQGRWPPVAVALAGLAVVLAPSLALLLLALGLVGLAMTWPGQDMPPPTHYTHRRWQALTWVGWLWLPFIVGTLVRLGLGFGLTDGWNLWTADSLPSVGAGVTLAAWLVSGVGLALGGGVDAPAPAPRVAGAAPAGPDWPRAVGGLLWAALLWRWGLPPAAGLVVGLPTASWLGVALAWLVVWLARPRLGRALAPVAVGSLAVLAWTPAALAGHLLWLLGRELAWNAGQASGARARTESLPDEHLSPGWGFAAVHGLGGLLLVLGGMNAGWWLGVALAVVVGCTTLAPGTPGADLGEDPAMGIFPDGAWPVGRPPGPRWGGWLAAWLGPLAAGVLTCAPWLLVGGAARLDASMLNAPPLAYRGPAAN